VIGATGTLSGGASPVVAGDVVVVVVDVVEVVVGVCAMAGAVAIAVPTRASAMKRRT
jgi:hypothetical protein